VRFRTTIFVPYSSVVLIMVGLWCWRNACKHCCPMLPTGFNDS